MDRTKFLNVWAGETEFVSNCRYWHSKCTKEAIQFGSKTDRRRDGELQTGLGPVLKLRLVIFMAKYRIIWSEENHAKTRNRYYY